MVQRDNHEDRTGSAFIAVSVGGSGLLWDWAGRDAETVNADGRRGSFTTIRNSNSQISGGSPQ